MSTRIAVLAIALALVTTGCVMSGGYQRPAPPRPVHHPPPPPSPSIDVGFFYDSLAPYGDWYLDAEFGWVWAPRGMAYGWRPYTEGYWLYTDYGWTWVSSWNWGWAPFHYGRWHFHPRRGWVWLPGRDWAPAWVAWRSGNGWVGWAPLPPRVRFRAGVGLDFGNAQLDAMIDVHWWSFVDQGRLTDRRLRAHIMPEPRNVTLVRATRDITRYEVNKERIIVRGVDVDNLSRASGHAVPRYVLREDASRSETGPARVSSGEVHMYRPAVREVGPERTPPGHVRKEQTEPSPRPSATRPAPPSSASPQRPTVGEDDRERARLEDQLRREQTALEREHRKEAARPPANVSREELQRRHEQEMKALRERAERERTLQEARAKEERQKAKEAEQPEKEKASRDASKTRGGKKPSRR